MTLTDSLDLDNFGKKKKKKKKVFSLDELDSALPDSPSGGGAALQDGALAENNEPVPDEDDGAVQVFNITVTLYHINFVRIDTLF